MELAIDTVLEDLKDGKTPKTQESLDKLNQVLEAYYNSGHRDFSVTTIGRTSSQDGGVGYQAIRGVSQNTCVNRTFGY